MSIYDELAIHQAPTPFATSSEAIFFADNSYLLANSELWSRFLKPLDSFETIRANIILRSLINKNAIERLYFAHLKAEKDKKGKQDKSSLPHLSLSEAMEGFPYLLFKGKKIYVPIFPEVLNTIYSGDFAKLAQPPYKSLVNAYQAATVDPFDYYGYELFDSYFTKLVPIRKTPKTMAAFDYDAETLYFINDQGRLDAKLCFFDRDLPRPVKTHLIKRVEAVADAYFQDDRNAMFNALLSNNLVSSSLMHQLAGKEIKFEEKSERKREVDE